MSRHWLLIASGVLLAAGSIAAQEPTDKPLVFRDDLSAAEKKPFDAIADLAKKLTDNEADQLRLRLAFTEALLALDARNRLVEERTDTKALEAILRKAPPSLSLSLTIPAAQGEPTPALPQDSEEPRLRGRPETPRLGLGAEDFKEVPLERARAESRDLFRDEEWIRNMNYLLDKDPTSLAPRIYGGGGRVVTDLKDCVAIGVFGGGAFDSCCTGTIIAPNAVITAAHCVPCRATHIFVGSDSRRASQGKVYRIKGSPVVHHSYTPSGKIHDLTILFLEENVPGVKVRQLATISQIRAHGRVLLVAGFGLTEAALSGVKFETKVAVSGLTSGTEEIIAGGNNAHDTCQGDSGGPAYLELPNQKRLLLAGVTSRGGRCGTGGIYTRVAIDEPHGQWILQQVPALRSMPGGDVGLAPVEPAPVVAPEAKPAEAPLAPRSRPAPAKAANPADDEPK